MTPRITPIDLADAEPETQKLLAQLSALRGADTRVLNVMGTLARHPALFRRWLVFATYLLNDSTLEPRLRELVVLRVGWLCRSPYEWGQHVHVGRRAGVTDSDLERLARGPQAPGWTAAEAAVLQAADELVARHTIGDETWRRLAEQLTTEQALDLVFLVGQYQLVSGALNACRVERDDGLDERSMPFPPSAD